MPYTYKRLSKDDAVVLLVDHPGEFKNSSEYIPNYRNLITSYLATK